MFRQITLKNYRTHRETSLALHPLTLLVGNNNSGKSNILQGIRHLSHLVWRSDPHRDRPDLAKIRAGADYFYHRYRLAKDDEPMAWSVIWQENNLTVSYELELFQTEPSKAFVRCRERVRVQSSNADPLELSSGFNEEANQLTLRTHIEHNNELSQELRKICREFFRKLGTAFVYHFQPSYLNNSNDSDSRIRPYGRDERVAIPSALGYEGGNFQRLIFYAKEREERVFSRFVALVRRFNEEFHGVRLNLRGFPIWEFDLGSTRTDRLLEEFAPDLLSDGFLKAAVIALIVSLERSPSIIMVEEIENGINPGNIREIMNWLWQAASTQRPQGMTQFILTSHSPSVLREFYRHLENVYTLRLDKSTHQSDVRNLNRSLETLVGIGSIEGSVTKDEQGNRRVEIPPYQLTELWYSGTIG